MKTDAGLGNVQLHPASEKFSTTRAALSTEAASINEKLHRRQGILDFRAMENNDTAQISQRAPDGRCYAAGRGTTTLEIKQ